MPAPTSTVVGAVEGDLYQQVQQFYAAQMQLLDRGEAAAWARTFTADGAFATSVEPTATRGHEALTESVRAATAELVTRGVVHRHWLGMLHVERDGDGGLRTRFYALVIRTPKGGTPVIWRSCVGEDRLVCHDGGWLVRERRITRDDLP
jgi:hypothetical protein